MNTQRELRIEKKRLQRMSHFQLETFAAIAIGYISTTEGFSNEHPDVAFDYIYDAMVEHLNREERAE